MSIRTIRPSDLVPPGAVVPCEYCGAPLVLDGQPPDGSPACDAYENVYDPDSLRAGWFTAEVDHVMPLSQGGPDTAENTVPSCRPCNRSKGARTPQQWTRE